MRFGPFVGCRRQAAGGSPLPSTACPAQRHAGALAWPETHEAETGVYYRPIDTTRSVARLPKPFGQGRGAPEEKESEGMTKPGEGMESLIFPGDATSPTPFGLSSAGLWDEVEVGGEGGRLRVCP